MGVLAATVVAALAVLVVALAQQDDGVGTAAMTRLRADVSATADAGGLRIVGDRERSQCGTVDGGPVPPFYAADLALPQNEEEFLEAAEEALRQRGYSRISRPRPFEVIARADDREAQVLVGDGSTSILAKYLLTEC